MSTLAPTMAFWLIPPCSIIKLLIEVDVNYIFCNEYRLWRFKNGTFCACLVPFREPQWNEVAFFFFRYILIWSCWRLKSVYLSCSFGDLKSGLNCLKRKVSQHKEGPLSFFKANVQPVMECLETLSSEYYLFRLHLPLVHLFSMRCFNVFLKLGLKNAIDSSQHPSNDEMTRKLEAAIVSKYDGDPVSWSYIYVSRSEERIWNVSILLR